MQIILRLRVTGGGEDSPAFEVGYCMVTTPLPGDAAVPTALSYRSIIAGRLLEEHRAVAGTWLSELRDLLPIDAREVFPTDALLDHIPMLIMELAEYLNNPSEEAIGANTAVLAKAQELGHLRHTQGASLHQLIREFRILGAILTTFVKTETARMNLTPSPTELIDVIARLDDCVGVLLQTTVDTFVTAYKETIELQNERLESFNRMVSHELRQPLGVLQFSIAALHIPATLEDPAKTARVLTVLDRNVRGIVDLTRKLESMSRLQAEHEGAQRHKVEVATLTQDIAVQLREMAHARGVDIRVSTELPVLTVDVGRLQLVVMNLVSNAIKYCDPSKAERFVRITPGVAPSETTCAFRVTDNGLGMEAEDLKGIFGRFFRPHAARNEELGIEGMGLGLSIVSECVEQMLGTIRVESTPGEGTTFTVVLPLGNGEPALAGSGD
ncbi:MAG: HAMP domain-containing histidine kinase [Acidobacteria bacterium]|nr:HAMP domain-containing histidine kinase [Acidobacteriota bacterium]